MSLSKTHQSPRRAYKRMSAQAPQSGGAGCCHDYDENALCRALQTLRNSEASNPLDYKYQDYRTPSNSTSKIRVELGGITGGRPAAPYARSGGIISFRLPPTFIDINP